MGCIHAIFGWDDNAYRKKNGQEEEEEERQKEEQEDAKFRGLHKLLKWLHDLSRSICGQQDMEPTTVNMKCEWELMVCVKGGLRICGEV
jgi:hypothetical protein